jgi:hypothetical protein
VRLWSTAERLQVWGYASNFANFGERLTGALLHLLFFIHHTLSLFYITCDPIYENG